MGACVSSNATEIRSTSKVIFPDGHLQEYSGVTRAFQILRKESEGDVFLCSADDMDFNGYVSAVGSDELLLPGQIYFVLPKSILKRRLQSDEMASLAVRASSALTKNGAIAVVLEEKMRGGVGCKKSAVAPVEERRRRINSRKGSGFSPELTVIAE